MCAYNVAARGVVSIKQLNWNITGGRFRSYVLWVISHNHLQNGLYVKEGRRRYFTARFLCATPVCVLCSKCHDALVRNDDNTGNPFRSSDLVVMSHARCLCAMPVNFGGVKEFVLLRLLIHIYI